MKENGVGGSSPTCFHNGSKFMVDLPIRGGVPANVVSFNIHLMSNFIALLPGYHGFSMMKNCKAGTDFGTRLWVQNTIQSHYM